MTREEAIKVLRNESVQISGNAISVARWTSALDVAIRVLENTVDLKRKPCYLRCPYNTPKGCMVAETGGDCILEKVAEQLLVAMNGRGKKHEEHGYEGLERKKR